MNNGFYQGLEYIGTRINRASTTKQSIITAANTYENVMQKIKEIEIEKDSQKEIKDEEPKDFNTYFNPSEVEPIVLKKKEEER